MMPSLGADFAWLAQDQERRDPDETEVIPPLPIGAPLPSGRNTGLSNVEKIMLMSLILNTIWFAVYAVRSGPAHAIGGAE